jgi:CheY-like chemotaxis protein
MSSTRELGGTGLGLHVVRKLVTLFNGKVTADSSLGSGSCFTVRFPRSQPRNSPMHGTAAIEGNKQKKEMTIKAKPTDVVVIAVEIPTVGQMLGSLGYVVKCVGSGTAALDALEAKEGDTPYVVIIDGDISDMTSNECCKKIRDSYSSTCVAIVMVQRQAENDSTLLEGLSAGCDDAVSKPLRRKELVSRVTMQVHRMKEIIMVAAETAQKIATPMQTVEDITNSAQMKRRRLKRRPSGRIRKVEVKVGSL